MAIYNYDNIEYFGNGGNVHGIVKWLPYLHYAHAYGVPLSQVF
jgi:hypothetical protein